MDVIDQLADKYYDKFVNVIEEYIFLAMTEDCHPLIEDVERIRCITEGVTWEDYINGGDEDGNILHASHEIAQCIVNRMLKQYMDQNYG